MQKQLASVLSKKLLEAGIEGDVSNLEPLTGGASKEIWKFEVSNAKQSTKMILRRGSGIEGPLAIKTADEARIQKEVIKVGAPVPIILAVCKNEEELGDSYIMHFVEGESIARKILRDKEYKKALPVLAYQCGEAIAKIHNVDINNFSFLPKKPAEDQLEDLYSTYESFEQPSPVFEYAYLWLKEQDFGNFQESLVHGDFRLGNIIVNAEGLQSIIDWELAHIGNPLQDLGWVCGNSWRFGKNDKVVGGFGELEDLLEGYNSVSKLKVNKEMVRCWQVFGTFRWGVICLIQAYAHLNGTINSIEKAAIGRRAVSYTHLTLPTKA